MAITRPVFDYISKALTLRYAPHVPTIPWAWVDNRLIFAMTDRREETNLWNFAGLFLQLDCRDALFLDGDISQMAVNPAAPVEINLFGAMFIVSEPAK